MKTRAVRAVGLATVLVVGVGLATALPSGAATRTPSGPQFVRVSAVVTRPQATASARPTRHAGAHRAPKVAQASGEQVLQSFRGLQGTGSGGLVVAAGATQVVQVGGPAARIFSKSTGKVRNRTTNQLFGIPATVTLTEPTVVYDPLGRRWVIAAIADDAGDTSIAVRVSRGTSASSWFPAVYYGSAAKDGADIVESTPRIGTSSNKVAVTTVASDVSRPTVANRILVLPKNGKAGLYRDGKAAAWSALVNATYDGQMPAVNTTKQANLFIGVPDTNDVTVTTYSGAATSSPPAFSKSVTFPSSPLLPPPAVSQGSGDTLDLGPLTFTGAAWRAGSFWAAAAADCSGVACVRVFGLSTGAGVALVSQSELTAPGRDWFSPSLAVDSGGRVHVAVTDVGTGTGPSLTVLVRRPNGNWLGPRLVRAGRGVVDLPPAGGSSSWGSATAAALDPTSPWDIWVTGVAGDAGVPGGVTTRVARVSMAKNVATVKANRTRVARGSTVTFTVRLQRPGSRDAVKGLPVALQTRPASGGSWRTLQSGRTNQNGVASWRVTVKRTSQYRTLGQPVSQTGSPPDGRLVARVTSRPLTVVVT